MKKHKHRRGRIIHEGLVPDTDPIYERGWTILTGSNWPRDKPSNTTEDEEEKTERK